MKHVIDGLLFSEIHRAQTQRDERKGLGVANQHDGMIRKQKRKDEKKKRNHTYTRGSHGQTRVRANYWSRSWTTCCRLPRRLLRRRRTLSRSSSSPMESNVANSLENSGSTLLAPVISGDHLCQMRPIGGASIDSGAAAGPVGTLSCATTGGTGGEGAGTEDETGAGEAGATTTAAAGAGAGAAEVAGG